MTLEFNHATHTYTYGGKVVPSVTQILQATGAIDYSGVPRHLLEAAAKLGKEVHQRLQYEDDGLAVTWPLAQLGYLEAYNAFKRDHEFEVLQNEARLYNRQWRYAGTLDRTGTTRGNRLVLPDIKTGQESFAHIIQVAAYAGMLVRPRSYDRVVLYLRSNGTYRTVWRPGATFDEDFKLWRGEMWNFRQMEKEKAS